METAEAQRTRRIVPKGAARPRTASSSPTIDEQRAIIFALPIPPAPATKRTYPIDTMVGRLMRLRRMTVMEMMKHPGVPRDRQMTEILAGREGVGRFRHAFAEALGVDPELL